MTRLPRRLAILGCGALAYAVLWRPRMNRWGATEDEARRWLPGDDLHPDRRLVSTRAITVRGSPEEIWPWIVQMGHERAGFYSHDWVERLLGVRYADGRSATRIHPEFQQLSVGDTVPYHDRNDVPVEALEYPRLLVAGEWFVLEPIDDARTRVLVRTRGGWIEPLARSVPVLGRFLAPLGGVLDRGPGEILHFYMETGMLAGLKKRVEAASPGGRVPIRSHPEPMGRSSMRTQATPVPAEDEIG